MEIKETTVKMYPDGKVDGVKIVKRGPSTIADPLPLKEHLEKKHFVRMAKIMTWRLSMLTDGLPLEVSRQD